MRMEKDIMWYHSCASSLISAVQCPGGPGWRLFRTPGKLSRRCGRVGSSRRGRDSRCVGACPTGRVCRQGVSFEFILNDLALDRSRVTMVGDSYEEDVLGANRAGLRAVWFNPRSDAEHSGELRRTVHDLRDLEPSLKAWGPETNG